MTRFTLGLLLGIGLTVAAVCVVAVKGIPA
jgi:heme/copper-type cytochrome/quinol oxidase subunit 4